MSKTSTNVTARFFAFASSIALAATLYAGSTGTTQLQTPQGSGSGTDFGDYVSDANGLNTSYHYFVEVPPGLTHLVVDIFDGDVGRGNNEDTAGRDRPRNAYDSSVNYKVFNPSGAARTTLFTTGNTTAPADNAWATLFDSTGDFVRDNFGANAYTNNDGNVNWSTNWTETNDDNSATAGVIRVTGGQLRLGDNGGTAASIQREANLSGFTTATLTFDVSTTGVDAGDQMRLDVSSNGGASWTALETFTGPVTGSRTYNISSYIATNTRIRFISVNGYNTNDFLFIDNLQIKDSVIAPGHWEVRIDMSSAITNGDDINAFGIRAHDGDATSGGTELNLYADSEVPVGMNPPNAGVSSRSYNFYPYITSGCSCGHNDYDFDTNSGPVTSATYTSRTAAFAHTITALSANDVWARNTVTGWTTDQLSEDYGIWSLGLTIGTYLVTGTPNGNYGVLYDNTFQAAANPPTANPGANSFRIYMPTDAGVAPVKPYLEQDLVQRGNSVLAVGQPKTYTVTVRLQNPSAFPITFTAAKLVTANVPGGGAVYGGNAQVAQGTLVSQPAVNGTGNLTWNPGTLAAGATAILSYDVIVTPTSAGQRILVTASAASGNGTRATWIDETGNTTQARATYTFGPLCELAATEGLLTEALVSSFDASVRGGHTVVEWKTSSEAGTIGFHLYRVDRTTGALTRLDRGLLPANVGAPQGGVYHFTDSSNNDSAPTYVLEELTANGAVNRYGPYQTKGLGISEPKSNAEYEHAPRTAAKRMLSITSASARDLAPVTNATKKNNMAAVMVGVPTTGVVRVAVSDLATILGATPQTIQAAISRGGLSLTSNGAQVGWTATANADAILFFGEQSNSIYANDRVYRIELLRGTTMPTVTVAPTSPTTTTFAATADAEVDSFPATVLPLDPESDYWFWDFVLSGDATDGQKQFTVAAPSMASSSGATLQVRLQGATSTSHHARISMNGTELGEVTWNALDASSTQMAIPSAVLLSGANQVKVEGVVDPGVSNDVFYIDGFQIGYQRSASLDAGKLQINTTPGQAITAGSFTSTPILLDVTNRLRPALLQGASVASGNASFVAPAGATTLFLSDSNSLVAPSFLRGSAEAMLTANNQADYVVIAPAALHASANGLAQLRQRDGLQTFVADLEQIYDEFSGGNPTPHAIHDFIASTTHWSRVPHYFALAGAGTADYRGIDDPPGLIPAIMTKTTNGLFAADSLFGDFDGDGLPEVAIGRIPINSASQLDAYVQKLDTSAHASAATSHIVFSADATDRGADFAATSQPSEAPLDSRPTTKIYVDQLGAAGARSALLNAWQNGASLFSWVGHGGLDRISNASLLTTDDAPTLTSTTGVLPVVVAMTCTINRFEIGSIESLGAALTRVPGAGALAVWSASGLSINGVASDLERSFMQLASRTPTARIGDLVVQSLAANPSIGETGSIYLLLGDPAIKLALPPQSAPSGSTPRHGE